MTSEEAIGLAKNVAEKEGWLWKEPVHAVKKRRWWMGTLYWEINSNAGNRGANVRVRIDNKTGEVLNKGYAPR